MLYLGSHLKTKIEDKKLFVSSHIKENDENRSVKVLNRMTNKFLFLPSKSEPRLENLQAAACSKFPAFNGCSSEPFNFDCGWLLTSLAFHSNSRELIFQITDTFGGKPTEFVSKR